LGGGFPDRSLILLRGFPGCGSDEFAQQFLSYGLNDGSYAVYFALRRTAAEILHAMAPMNRQIKDYASSGKLLFIDDYTARLKEFAVEHNLLSPKKVEFGTDPFWKIDTLKRLDNFVKDKMKTMEGEVRGVLDNLSYLLRTYHLEDVLKFLEELQYCTQIYGGVYMLLLVDGMHDSKTIATLSDLADGVIRFVELEKGTELITRMRFIKMEKTVFNFKVIPHTTIRTGLLYYKTEAGINFEKPHRIDPREVL
jgi:KaiC/GvpD/RAD55 family RecA-like ATPase